MTGSLDFRDRAAKLDALDGARFDLMVIGGGVTGAGVARDAAMRGLSVLLAEARDFASGTSSKSSKMIHGGLRYMAQGDLGLVHEAATERQAVERIAPHLTRQTPFVIPAKDAGGLAKLRAGMWAFEKLGSVPKDRRHQVWSTKNLMEREPAINATGSYGAVAYPEYLTDDAKLTVANVRSAVAHGAVAISYAPVERLVVEDGRATGAVLADALGGGGARVFARVIVNAAGPWMDAIRALEDAGAQPRLQLTKGIHLVVSRKRLPVERVIIMPAEDRRSVFAVPKGAFTYLGTTDTFYPDASYWPRVEAKDADYLFAAAARRFTIPPLTHADVVSAWAGARPLVAQAGKSPSEISRHDEVWTGPGGVFSIAGGKLTAYRKMAERIVDMAEDALGRKPSSSATDREPLVGGDLDVTAVTAKLALRVGLDEAERLIGLYGSEAPDLVGGPAVEARHAVLHEGAVTLEDWWVRRAGRSTFDAEGGMAALAPAAAEMAVLLGWSTAEAERQIGACRAIRRDVLSNLQPQAAS